MATKKVKKVKKAKKAYRARKTGTGIAAQKRLMAENALKLSESARKEVGQLLKQQRAGTITGEQLECGLEEVVDNLKRMLNHILASL
jgi:hypothetical protein